MDKGYYSKRLKLDGEKREVEKIFHFFFLSLLVSTTHMT